MSASFANAAEAQPPSKSIEKIVVVDSKTHDHADALKQVAKNSVDLKAHTLADSRSDVLSNDTVAVSKSLTEAIAQLTAPSPYQSASLGNRNRAEKSFTEVIKNSSREAVPIPQHDENLN